MTVAYATRRIGDVKRERSTATLLEIPLGSDALAALDVADAQWSDSRGRPAAARSAAIALAGLVFGSEDTLQLSDELAAPTIGSVATAKAFGVELPSIEALVARTLGYGAAAIRLDTRECDDVASADAARMKRACRRDHALPVRSMCVVASTPGSWGRVWMTWIRLELAGQQRSIPRIRLSRRRCAI